jgi:hypothetical protein
MILTFREESQHEVSIYGGQGAPRADLEIYEAVRREQQLQTQHTDSQLLQTYYTLHLPQLTPQVYHSLLSTYHAFTHPTTPSHHALPHPHPHDHHYPPLRHLGLQMHRRRPKRQRPDTSVLWCVEWKLSIRRRLPGFVHLGGSQLV